MGSKYSYKDKHAHRPFPEVVLPGTWIVRPTKGGGATSFDPATRKSRMWVPMASKDREERRTRIHEMLHARFTRWTDLSCDRSNPPAAVDRWFANVFEDVRIEELGARSHESLDVRPGTAADKETCKRLVEVVKGNLKTAPVWVAAGQMTGLVPYSSVGVFGSRAYSEVKEAVQEALVEQGYSDPAVMIRILEGLAQEVLARPHPDQVVAATKRAVELFERAEEKKKESGDGGGSESKGEREAEEVMEGMEAYAPDEGGEEMSLEEADADKTGGGKWDVSEERGRFGPIRMVRHDLVQPHGKGLAPDKRIRPSQMGTVPQFMHRWCIDMAVFRHRKRRPGKAILLVDTSGSMRMTKEELEGIMRAAPGAMIALYHFGGTTPVCERNRREKHGCVHIVADGGKRIAGECPNGQLNVVDGTALDWLAKQKGLTRIWVCDGYVTGLVPGRERERHTKYLVRLCREKVKRHGIKHVLDVDAAVKLLNKLNRGRVAPA